jgi:VWFA-related protein
MESQFMNKNIVRKGSLLLGALVAVSSMPLALKAAANSASAASDPSAVVMTVTAKAKKDAQPPAVTKNDVELYQGKERVQVANFKRGETLYLAVLIDDSLRSDIANQWSDLRAFLMAQPQTTYVAVAYARNGVAMVAQDFTTDHALAAKALRLPLGNLGAATSPYLSVQDWIKRWPVSGERSSIILFSSGVDYFRGGPATLDPDLDTTIARAQKKNVNIWTIYAPDSGRRGRGSFRAFNWQSNLDRLSQETGAESYSLGLGAPVNLKPYFDRIQMNLNNQYLLAFVGDGGHKGKYEPVKVTSELRNVGFLTPSEVFLPAVR